MLKERAASCSVSGTLFLSLLILWLSLVLKNQEPVGLRNAMVLPERRRLHHCSQASIQSKDISNKQETTAKL